MYLYLDSLVQSSVGRSVPYLQIYGICIMHLGFYALLHRTCSTSLQHECSKHKYWEENMQGTIDGVGVP